MKNLFNSKFETYLMDQELELNMEEEKMRSNYRWCIMMNIQKAFYKFIINICRTVLKVEILLTRSFIFRKIESDIF